MRDSLTGGGWTGGKSLQSLIDTKSGTVSDAVPSMNTHNNLLSFLTVLQYYNIDLLSITSQADLAQSAGGATAQIQQRYVEHESGFAFKIIRMRDESGLENEEATFNALVSEITVFGHPSLRYHHSLVDLEGVCWEVPLNSNHTWPILVLERARYGSLSTFMRTERGRQTTLEERIDFCIDVASAIFAMHAHNFVHGDVKPQNVLVFEDKMGGVYVKLADFGFAGWAANDSDEATVNPPKSVPWNAPEHHHRGFPIQEAKAMDIYSLGLVCLWLLFHGRSVADCMRKFGGGMPERIEDVGQMFENVALLEQLKAFDTIRKLACSLAQEHPLPKVQRNDIADFFNSTLALDPRARILSIAKLEPSLDEAWILGPKASIVSPEIDHATVEFQIGPIIRHLLRTHIRIRRAVVSFLQDQASSHPSQQIRRNAAFQLAVCFRIGFGVPSGEAVAIQYLDSACKSFGELEDEIGYISGSLDPLSLQYYNGNLNNHAEGSKLSGEPLGRQYAKGQIFENYEGTLQREIQDIRKAFGPGTSSLAHLRRVYSEMLQAQGKFQEAELVIAEMIQDSRYPEETDLSIAERKAKSIQQNLLQNRNLPKLSLPKLWSPDLGPKLPALEKITASVNRAVPSSVFELETLALIYKAQGRLDEAAWLLVWPTDWYITHLGEAHQSTLRHYKELGEVYCYMDRLLDAERLMSYASTMYENLLGPQHERTMGALIRLAQIHMELSNYSTAETIMLRLLGIQESTLEPNSTWIIKSLMTLGTLYQQLLRLPEAERTLQRAYEASKAVSGEDDPETILSMSLLAITYNWASQFDKAEAICAEALAVRDRAKNEQHPYYLRIKNSLGTAYLRQGRLVEAEQVALSTLEEHRRISSEDDTGTRNTIDLLTEVLHELNRCDEEKALIEDMVAQLRAKNGQDHWFTLHYMRKRAWCLWKEGRRIQALALLFRCHRGVVAVKELWRKHSFLEAMSRTPALVFSIIYERSKLFVNFVRSRMFSPTLRGRKQPQARTS